MILQLKQIFEGQKQLLDFETEIPCEELEQLEPYDTYAAPVRIKGSVKNRAGVITLDMNVAASLEQTCDRCMKAFVREYSYDPSHTLVTALDNEEDEGYEYDDYVTCPDKTLDVSELALTDLKLGMPTKILCKEDCKGLCPVCGKDLNEGACEHIE